MKIQHKVLGFALIGGTCLWIIDAVCDYFFFREGSFFEVLLFDVHLHHFYIRIAGIFSFFFFGIIISKMLRKQKKAEEDLRLVHSDLEQIFNAAVPLCVISKDYRLVRVNDTFCSFFQLQREAVIGKICAEVWQGPFCNTINCPLQKILNGAEQCEDEVEKHRINGREVSVIITAIPYRDPDGHLMGIVENFTDITLRKQAEQELRTYRNHLEEMVEERTKELTISNDYLHKEIQERQRAEETLWQQAQILDQIHDSVMALTLDGYITSWNKGAERQFGYKVSEILGRHASILSSDKDRYFLKRSIIEPLKQTGINNLEVSLRRKGGDEFLAHISLSLLKDNAGTAIGLIAYTMDITARKLAEVALRESEEKYATLVEYAKDGVVIIQDGLFQFINNEGIKIIGYAVEDLLNQPYLSVIKDEYKAIAISRYEAHLAGEKVPSFIELKIITKDGREKEVELTSNLIQYHGKPAVMVLYRDITERKMMEEELQKVQKLESLSVLAGGIAHDFNNLLTAIIGNLSLVDLYAKSGKDMAGILEEIKLATHQTRDLTKQLLTFARGGQPLKIAVSLSKVLKDTVSLVLSGSKVRGLLSIPDDLWMTEIDEGQINQAINNVMMNAEQSMPQGGIIEVHAENLIVTKELGLPLKEGKYVKLSIKDQGIGIPEENMVKIFDPFFSTKVKGTGLGLAITYSIIKKHEGYITVDSQPGKGTVFSFYLPALDGPRPVAAQIEEEKPVFGQGKILFMDDQPGIRDVVGQMLAYLGYEVEFARDGEEAIELYKQRKGAGDGFDLIILDLTIPGGMGGKEAMQKLCELDPEVKAIVSSGYSHDPVIALYKEFGFHGVVNKPYEINELSRVVAKVIRGEGYFQVKERG